jgi:hypothetical protein
MIMRCDICGSKECCGGELGVQIGKLEAELAKAKDSARHTPMLTALLEAGNAENDRLRELLSDIYLTAQEVRAEMAFPCELLALIDKLSTTLNEEEATKCN